MDIIFGDEIIVEDEDSMGTFFGDDKLFGGADDDMIFGQ